MSKVNRIEVSNFKAVAQQGADFNGCTAIITGGNGKGKSSFLSGLFERLQGEKPTVPLKTGEKEGYSEVTLTDGCKLRWEFKEGGKEKLTYITANGIKTPCTREICEKYYPTTFNVDTFLNDSPAKQRKQLQQIVGLDFTDIDARYKEAFDNRTFVNRKAGEEKIKFQALGIVPKVDYVSLSELDTKKETVRKKLNYKYLENVAANNSLRTKHEEAKRKEGERVRKHNDLQSNNTIEYNACFDAASILTKYGCTIDLTGFLKIKADAILPQIVAQYPIEPTYPEPLPDNKELLDIEAEMTAAHENNRKADAYSNWVASKTIYENSQIEATEADKKVKDIEAERLALIKSANMPEGFTFDDDGILFNGLPFSRNQQASSAIYIAALKLAEMTLGEIKTLHFDASFLDNVSLKLIQDWAKEKDLQLLIERPDLDGGEIEYQIIQN